MSDEAANLVYRRALKTHIPAMAAIRAGDWGSEEYWQQRIRQYLTHALHPKEALHPRVAFVCAEREQVVGMIAGHLTRRFGCEGELEWISVRPQWRRRGVATGLLVRLAKWFARHRAKRICVDVEPSNRIARNFYARHGAQNLKPHWMVWHDMPSALRLRGNIGVTGSV